MSEICLASNLLIPLEAVTQTFAILAKRGAGKTYTALVMVEEMLANGLQVVVIDPVGVCWGLRVSADGKSAGVPIVVLGGDHGDVGIEASWGKAIADFVIQEKQSVVIDLSSFSNNEMAQIVTDFAEQLYQKNRSPLHLVLDEADSFAPQKPMPGEQRMLGAIDKIVRRGRARGLGVSLVSQRPAVINKNVLTQIEVLIALRTVSPQDRGAIESWVEVHGSQEQHNELLTSLPSLPTGAAWVWSPGWLDIFQRVQIRQRKTFDSSATPKIGVALEPPKVLAQVDLFMLQQRFAANSTRQQSSMPQQSKALNEIKRLEQLVIELDKQLAAKSINNQPVFQDGEVERLESAIQSLKNAGSHLSKVSRDLRNALSHASTQNQPITSKAQQNLENRKFRSTKTPKQSFSATSLETDGKYIVLSTAQQRILDTLAAFESLGKPDVARSNVAVFVDQSPKSSGFTKNLSLLRSQGLIEYPSKGFVSLTDHGRVLAKIASPSESLTQLQRAWYGKLPSLQVKILEVLVARHPDSIDRQTLAELVGQSARSTAYTSSLAELRSQGLVDYPCPKQVAVTDLLFPSPMEEKESSRDK